MKEASALEWLILFTHGDFIIKVRLSTGFDISTCLLAPAIEFLKKGLSGKYILVLTCPNEEADFLSTTHFLNRKMAQIEYANNATQFKEIGFEIH